MSIMSTLARMPHRLDPGRVLGLLLAFVLAASGPIAEASPATRPSVSRPGTVATITELTRSFTSPEGTAFSGIVATFNDSVVVAASNFVTITINWGDGTVPSAGTVMATLSPNVFEITGSHTYAEEGSYLPVVTFHDNSSNTNGSFTDLSATVEDAPLCVCAPVPAFTRSTFTGAGTSAVNAAMAAFKMAIGGADNGGTPSPQPGGFRTINWDGVLLDGSDFGGNSIVIDMNHTVGIPINRFQSRGLDLARVYAVSAAGFSDVNPSVTSVFTPAFSAPNTFSPFNTHVVDVELVAAASVTATTIRAAATGFGAVFLNVRNPNQSSIEFFDGPISIEKDYVPAGVASAPAFLGAVFDKHVVTRVRLTLGDGTVFRFDGTTFSAGAADNTADATNVVALDDLAYGEPQPPSTTTSSITATAGAVYSGTVGSFVDGDPSANKRDFTALIDWGDGHRSAGRISGGPGVFTVSGSNIYAMGGIYRTRLTVQDLGGADASGPGSAATVQPFILLPNIQR